MGVVSFLLSDKEYKNAFRKPVWELFREVTKQAYMEVGAWSLLPQAFCPPFHIAYTAATHPIKHAHVLLQ